VPVLADRPLPTISDRAEIVAGCEDRGVDLLTRLRLERPVVQAGLGGGLAGAPLAAAVSAAGGLGTVGSVPDPRAFAAELRRARATVPPRPAAGGEPARAVPAPRPRGRLPGGRRRRRRALLRALPAVGRAPARRGGARVAPGRHGGAGPPRAALDAGAAAVVAGTRFLLTEECRAHPGYKARALGATRTLRTLLFSAGWADPHRVLPNAATDRWCTPSARGPAPALVVNRVLAPAVRRLPPGIARHQRVGLPFFGPAPLLAGADERLLDVTPLYAGVCAREIDRVVPAAGAVALLDPW
jgi:nitronate monooxygenase